MKDRTLARSGGVAILVAAAICLVPSGAMAKGDAHAAAKKNHEAQQDFNIRRNTRTNNHQRTLINKATNAVAAAVDELATQSGRIKHFEDIEPTLLAALTALQNGLTTVGNGLTTVGNGLVSLKTLATSTEYGFGQLVVLVGATPTPEAGSFIETPNVPDDVQQAQTVQAFTAQHTGTLIVSYGVRSTESDGTGAANPAAVCRVWVRNEANDLGQTAANAALGGLPFQPVNTKSTPTSTDPANAGFPFGLKTTGADADVTQNLATSVAVTAGDTYEAGMSCVDTTPSADDPSA
jgi:hypothetical protein